MNKILIVHTSWYSEYINEMVQIATNVISDSEHEYETTCAPGAIELAALGKHHLIQNKSSYYSGVLFLGIVVRGENRDRGQNVPTSGLLKGSVNIKGCDQ